MVLPLWRSLHSLNLMLPKEDRKAMLLRLFNEDTPLMDHSKDRFHNNNDSSKPQPNAETKGEPDEGEEADADTDVKDKTSVKEEDDVVPEQAETVENGVEDGARKMLSGASKEEVEDGV